MQYWDDATKGMKLRFESMGFRVWNQGFQGLISMVSGRKTLDISNEGCQEDQLKIIVRFFLQTVRFLTNVLLKIIPTLQWIFIQPHPHPLPVGEGSEYPRFLLEDGARRPPSYYDLQSYVLFWGSQIKVGVSGLQGTSLPSIREGTEKVKSTFRLKANDR